MNRNRIESEWDAAIISWDLNYSVFLMAFDFVYKIAKGDAWDKLGWALGIPPDDASRE